MDILHDLFVGELGAAYNAEARFVNALSKWMRKATDNPVKEAINSVMQESIQNAFQIAKLFKVLNIKTVSSTSRVATALVRKGDEFAHACHGTGAVNFAMVSVVRMIVSHKMSAYTCLNEWAKLVGNGDATETFSLIVEQEKRADEMLTLLVEALPVQEEAVSVVGATALATQPELSMPWFGSAPILCASRPLPRLM